MRWDAKFPFLEEHVRSGRGVSWTLLGACNTGHKVIPHSDDLFKDCLCGSCRLVAMQDIYINRVSSSVPVVYPWPSVSAYYLVELDKHLHRRLAAAQGQQK